MKHEITSRNTKNALAQSLKNVMYQKSFSKISVSEIIADCGVNRKTFYYHFEDKYDLLKWMLEDQAIEVVKHFDLVVDYEEALQFIMDYIDENNYIISCAYDSIGGDELKRFFCKDFNELVSSIILSAEKMSETTLPEDYRNFLCTFYTDALGGMLVDWIKNPKKQDREQFITYLVKTMRDSLSGILEQNKGNL
ncbi:MAG: TetR/AcrR family transcriptional regulator C-terminal domain-containing protein [Lachnospiraceae bacterium]